MTKRRYSSGRTYVPYTPPDFKTQWLIIYRVDCPGTHPGYKWFARWQRQEFPTDVSLSRVKDCNHPGCCDHTRLETPREYAERFRAKGYAVKVVSELPDDAQYLAEQELPESIDSHEQKQVL